MRCVAAFGSALEFRVPEGGMALWARADSAIDVAAWMQAGEREGVRFASAQPYDFHLRDCAFLRLGFSYHDEAELDEAARRMARAWISLRAARVAVTSTERGAARAA